MFHNDPKNEAAKRALAIIGEGGDVWVYRCPTCQHDTELFCTRTTLDEMGPLTCLCGAEKRLVDWEEKR